MGLGCVLAVCFLGIEISRSSKSLFFSWSPLTLPYLAMTFVQVLTLVFSTGGPGGAMGSPYGETRDPREAEHGSIIVIHMPERGFRDWCLRGVGSCWTFGPRVLVVFFCFIILVWKFLHEASNSPHMKQACCWKIS